MYKVIIKYYGELCDKEQFEDEENFDEEVICETEDLAVVKNEIETQIKIWVSRNYVLDLQQDKTITMFYGCQENWNDYLEIYYIKDDSRKAEELFIDDLYAFGYIETIKYQVRENSKNLKTTAIENGLSDSVVLEMSLMVKLRQFLEDERFRRIFSIDDIKSISKKRIEFVGYITNKYRSKKGMDYFDNFKYMTIQFLEKIKKN